MTVERRGRVLTGRPCAVTLCPEVHMGRIVCDVKILGGKPCVAGTRIPVFLVLQALAAEGTVDQVLTEWYPQLAREDVLACLDFAARSLEHPAEAAAA